MRESLKPCPFCGKLPEIIQEKNGSVWIGCHNNNCSVRHVETDDFDTREEAIEAWNTRKGPTASSIKAIPIKHE